MAGSESINTGTHPDLRWYVASTTPMAEYAVREKLLQYGYEVFLPCLETGQRRPGRTDVPLLPGYLFLRYNIEAWGPTSLQCVPNLSGLVNFGGVIPSVPDEEVEELRERVEHWNRLDRSDLVHSPERPHPRKQASGLATVVTKARSAESRIRLLEQFLEQIVTTELKVLDVQPPREGSTQTTRRRPRRTRGRGRWIKGFGPRAA